MNAGRRRRSGTCHLSRGLAPTTRVRPLNSRPPTSPAPSRFNRLAGGGGVFRDPHDLSPPPPLSRTLPPPPPPTPSHMATLSGPLASASCLQAQRPPPCLLMLLGELCRCRGPGRKHCEPPEWRRHLRGHIEYVQHGARVHTVPRRRQSNRRELTKHKVQCVFRAGPQVCHCS